MLIKIIYKIAIVSLIAYSVLLTLYTILPIKFTNQELKEIVLRIIWFTGPILFLLTLLNLSIKKRNRTEALNQIFMKTILTIFLFILLGLYWFIANMSGYINDQILFEKKNSDQKILLRHYEVGGAYNSDRPKYEINKIIPLTEYFQIGLKVDTLNINKLDWTRKEN